MTHGIVGDGLGDDPVRWQHVAEDLEGPICGWARRVSTETGSAIVFGTAVVILAFLPLFALSGVEGRLFVTRRPRRVLPLRPEAVHARVEVLATGLGSDGVLLEAALAAGADGLVLVALGAGHLPPPVLRAASRAADRVPVVVVLHDHEVVPQVPADGHDAVVDAVLRRGTGVQELPMGERPS